MKKIKEISTKRYEIALYEDISYYTIIVTSNEKTVQSEKIVGYFSADSLFEMKRIELEGN